MSDTSMPLNTRIKLSAMMFLQFMMLPCWFIPMFAYVNKMEGGAQWAFWCGMIMAFGNITAPLFGMFSDRFLNSEKVLAICNFAGAGLLLWAWKIQDPKMLFICLLLVMLFYMPTWSLTATIAMANSTTEAFPQIRVFGSLGWVASAVFSIIGTKYFGIENFDLTSNIFLGGAIASVLGGVLAFFLPATPPKAKGTPMSIADALGLKALVLFKRLDFAVFSILILLAMVPFQWYNVYNGAYLDEKGFELLTVTMNWGQVFELIFMLMIPFILKKAGYKWAMVLGLGALVFRYGSFYLGANDLIIKGIWYQGQELSIPIGDFGGILIHGLIFGLLIIGSQMYVDAAAPAELRGQAQGLIGLIMFGGGTLLSNWVFQKILDANVVVKTKFATDGGPAKEVITHTWTNAVVMAAVLAVLMAVLFQPRTEKKA